MAARRRCYHPAAVMPISAAGVVPHVEMLGVPIHQLTLGELLRRVERALAGGERLLVANVNAHALNLAARDARFRAFLRSADLVFCDGFGVKWGARLLGHSLPERFTPPDFIPQLAALAGRHGAPVVLLGGRRGVAERAASRLEALVPGLRTAVHHGYFDKEVDSEENRQVRALIAAAGPGLLLVGLGMPLQERWLEENWGLLSARVAFPVGAAIDYLGGAVRRPPGWLTRHGLEWLGRLAVEPGRLAKRYLVGNPLFLWRVLRERFRRGTVEPPL
jgi:N-acetylglucosaminyldiphosphoundecaprenol N-acetyl-beta-D-mannosaminyltransferase